MLSFSCGVLCWLSLSLSVISKVDHKILVSFRLIQNFEVSNLAMAKVKKVNIPDTYLHVISSNCKLLNWTFLWNNKRHQVTFVNLPFYQSFSKINVRNHFSTWHHVNLAFCFSVILPTCHFVNLASCQAFSFGTKYFVDVLFCQFFGKESWGAKPFYQTDMLWNHHLLKLSLFKLLAR